MTAIHTAECTNAMHRGPHVCICGARQAEPNEDALRLLRYLWEQADVEVTVAAHDGGKVRDLFDPADPLVADIAALLSDTEASRR